MKKSQKSLIKGEKMRISLYVPKGTQENHVFIDKEIAQARNIKSKVVRNSIVSGLQAIRHGI